MMLSGGLPHKTVRGGGLIPPSPCLGRLGFRIRCRQRAAILMRYGIINLYWNIVIFIYCNTVLFLYCLAVVNGTIESGAAYACGGGYLYYGVQF